MSLPYWLKKPIPKSKNISKIRRILGNSTIHTVCESALCPNIGECFSKKTVTFMILGNICTRNCRFCVVNKGQALLPDINEPKNIALAAKKLDLDYIVITSVTRDDLPDGGASQFALTIIEIRKLLPNARIEVLIPDFSGNINSLAKIVGLSPNIVNHNMETVKRLYPKIRPAAHYERSLSLLKSAKMIKNTLYTKSGIMVGLGEARQEVVELMHDLRDASCDFITIGQYLQPSKDQVEVFEFINPSIFEEYKNLGKGLGFKGIFSGPFVRSSYQAKEQYV